MDTVKDMLSSLTSISAPSGYEMPIVQFLKDKLSVYSNLKIEEDVLGNLIVTKKGKTDKTIMLVAHCDEIGLMVSYIEESGYVRFTRIGGVDNRLLKGRQVKILHNGSECYGVIGTIPIHMRQNSNTKEVDESELWIDIGCVNKEETEKLVSVGDSIVIDSTYYEMPNNIIACRGLDNKAGVATLLKVLSLICDIECDVNISVVFSAQEEVGLRGVKTATYSISPDICIVVDVAHATDYPMINKAKYGDIHIGDGPIIPIGSDLTFAIQRKLQDITHSLNLEYQSLALSGFSGTDANAAQVTKIGCATGLISIPCRYMHSPVEVVSLDDIQDVVCVLTELIMSYKKYFDKS